MPPSAAILYIRERYNREQELEHRRNYNTTMLYYIAQPTRARPDALPFFKPLCAVKPDDNRTGDELVDEFFGGLGR